MLNRTKIFFKRLSYARKIFPFLDNEQVQKNINLVLNSKGNIRIISDQDQVQLFDKFCEPNVIENLARYLNGEIIVCDNPSKLKDIQKIISLEEYYLVTQPDKIKRAILLETSQWFFFLFEYYNDETRNWSYCWDNNFPAKQLKDAVEHALKQAYAEEDIELEIKRLLGPDAI